MRREWKPGAVAMLQYRDYQPSLALFDGDAQRWMDAEGATFDGDEDDLTITPLVALRLPNGALAGWPVLVTALRMAGEKTGLHMIFEDLIGQIERQTETKPEEPTGLGAVVEDANGALWVRGRREGAPWLSADGTAVAQAWRHLDAIRVLSPGVEDGTR